MVTANPIQKEILAMPTPLTQSQTPFSEALCMLYKTWQEQGSLSTLQQAAYDRLQAVTFPARREEAWKYMDLSSVKGTAFQPLSMLQPHLEASQTPSLEALGFAPWMHLIQDADRLVLLNGSLSPTLSHTQFPSGVSVESAGISRETADAMTDQLASESDYFVVLNSFLAENVLTITLAPHTVLTRPIHLVLACPNNTQAPVFSVPRIRLILGEGSQATVCVQLTETAISSESTTTLLENSVLDLQLAPKAQLDCTLLQACATEDLSNSPTIQFLATRASLQEASKLTLTTFSSGHQTARHSIHALFSGEQAECTLNGLSLPTGHGALYHHTVIEHARPHCTSHQLYKSILPDHTRTEFDGIIVVHPQANQTDAEQLNKTLLLSEDARVFTRPQLKIDADDVKCAHGATVGQLSEDELFYLLSRGLDKVEAQQLLTYGFAKESIEAVQAPMIRNFLNAFILKILEKQTLDAGLRSLS